MTCSVQRIMGIIVHLAMPKRKQAKITTHTRRLETKWLKPHRNSFVLKCNGLI